MKKNRFIGLCLASVSIFALASCGENSNNNSYIEVKDDYYIYNATFQNGVKKNYQLRKDVHPVVIGNTLVWHRTGDTCFYRYVLDIENNSLVWYEQNTRYSEYNKTCIEVTSGSIDVWLKEEMSDDFQIEVDYKNLDFSYTKTRYELKDGEWNLWWSPREYEFVYDNNENLIKKIDPDYNPKIEYDYNRNNKISSERYYYYQEENDEYVLTDVYDYTYASSNLVKKEYKDRNGYCRAYHEYSYDTNNNLINEKYYQINSDLDNEFEMDYEKNFEYDDNNHLIFETLRYTENDVLYPDLCWHTPNCDYTKEYSYENDKLIYEHDIFETMDIYYGYLYSEDEYFYSENETKEIHYDNKDHEEKEITIYDHDDRLLSREIYRCTNSLEELSYKLVYDYDTNHNLISEAYYYLNDDGILTLDDKYEYTYDSNNKLISKTRYMEDEGVLYLVEKYEYTYNSNNNILEEKYYDYYFREGIEEKSKNVYIYDSNGLLVKVEKSKNGETLVYNLFEIQ